MRDAVVSVTGPIKVGLVIDDHMARPGGVQEYVRGLYHYLTRHGHAAVIFSSGGGDATDDLRVVALGRALPFRGSGSTSSIPLTFASREQLRHLLAREACDVLHVMSPYSPTLSGRLLLQSRAANVMTFHVAKEPGWSRAMVGVLAKAQWRSLRCFGARIAVSPTAAATGRAYYGDDYTIIPNGVDTTRFAAGVVPMTERRDDLVNLLHVGRLEQRKGVVHLVRAFARLTRQWPNVRLIIGGDGPERGALEHLVQQLDLKQVVLLGYVPPADLPRLFASADIFCAPATGRESFGIVLIEAMAAGLPIVAAGNPGYAQLLTLHPGNLVVPPANERALAGALSVLVERADYRRTIGARNRVAARQYDWESVGAAVETVYRRLLSGQTDAVPLI